MQTSSESLRAKGVLPLSGHQPPRHQSLRSQVGFTLIELVTVIVVLAIIATLGTGFVVSTLRSYTDTQERTRLVNSGRQAIERVTRQLRGAVPNSIRVTNGGDCIEFLPVASGGYYLDSVPDNSNGAAASVTIATAPIQIDFGSANYVVIGGQTAGEVYGGGSIAILDSITANQLTLTAAMTWIRNSPHQRFFLADDPQAFCLSGGDLRFYQNYATPFTSSGLPSGVGTLMGQQVTSALPFQLAQGTEVRGTVVTIDLLFSENNQQVPIRQEVYVRNVL